MTVQAGSGETGEGITYRNLEPDEYPQAAELLRQNLEGSDLDREIDSDSRIVGAFHRTELVGCIHWSVREAVLWGKRHRIARAGPGATAGTFRRRGIQRWLLRLVLADMRGMGLSIVGQETPVIDFHRVLGWEIATFARKNAAAAEVFSSGPVPVAGRCVLAQAHHVDGILRLWRESVQMAPFTVHRDRATVWAQIAAGTWHVWVGRDGLVEGCTRIDDPARAGVANEIIAPKLSVLRSLLAWLASQASDAGRLEWWTPVGACLHSWLLLPDPRLIEQRIEADKLLRVVDAASLLRMIGRDGPSGPALTVRIADSVAPWNNQTFVVGPAGQVTAAGQTTPDVTLDVRGLIGLATGAVAWPDLLAAELAEVTHGGPDVRLSEPVVHYANWYPEPL